MGAYEEGETTLTRGLLRSLGPGMLLLADRNFFSFNLWNEARAGGAELVWRTKTRHSLPFEERLVDSSYMSHVQANDVRRKLRNPVGVALYVGNCVAVC